MPPLKYSPAEEDREFREELEQRVTHLQEEMTRQEDIRKLRHEREKTREAQFNAGLQKQTKQASNFSKRTKLKEHMRSKCRKKQPREA